MKLTESYEIQGASSGLGDRGQSLVKAACEDIEGKTRSARVARVKVRFDDLCGYVSEEVGHPVGVMEAVAYFEGALRSEGMGRQAQRLRIRALVYLKETKSGAGKSGGFERGEER